jgi:hypothetical protein
MSWLRVWHAYLCIFLEKSGNPDEVGSFSVGGRERRVSISIFVKVYSASQFWVCEPAVESKIFFVFKTAESEIT